MRRSPILTALMLACALAVPTTAGAHTGVAPLKLYWQSPSPKIGATLTVTVGQTLSVAFAAADVVPLAAVHISAARLPQGAALTAVDGNPASATLTWAPTQQQAGRYEITIAATDNLPLAITAPPLTFFVVVKPVVGTATTLSGVGNLSSWAYVNRASVARSAPSLRARAVAPVKLWTPENYPNLVLLLQQRYESSGWWVQVRLSSLPNGRTGWVPRRAVGAYHQVTTHLYVNRGAMTATLLKDGQTIFATRVGVGKPYWPTPHGEFYIREKITGFRNPMYGPIAYGTSARSAVLTDWPGGGFIGIHGTNEPGILPGRVSHGCIRMRNAAILDLARLLPLGTPLSVS